FQRAYQYTATPYPAWFSSVSIFLTPFINRKILSHRVKENKATTKLMIPVGTFSSIFYGSAFALAGFIIQDGDVTNGAGFTFVWSTLYLLVHGRKSLAGLRYGQPWPLFLATTLAGNAILHGRRF
ncbi:Aim19p ASCRUDRAFT_16638, partial [Ascoidea rubescens DSM 1968]